MSTPPALTTDTRALIVAFDGVLAETLALRARMWRDAAAAQQFEIDEPDVLASMPGRTFAEVSDLLIGRHDGALTDPVRLDLVALDAERRYDVALRSGVVFTPSVVTLLQQAVARGVRVVVRADSGRRQVERALQHTDLADGIAFVRCSDDPLPSHVMRSTGASIDDSWAAIDARLTAATIARPARVTIEATDVTALHAAPYVSRSDRWRGMA